MKNKICVYTICKNESQFVERWYKSMSEADAVVVLDTGSTDDTVEKLKKLGATVEQKIIDPWRFDVARNESMKLIPDDCNILVCTDLDEVLEPGWAKALRERWIDGVHRKCWYKYAWSHMDDGSDGRVFWYDKIHCRGYKWYYPVHETLGYDPAYKDKLEKMDELTIDEDVFKLHHYPVDKPSRRSYLPLLELRLEETPDEFASHQYLTHQYFYEGQYENCIKLGRKTIEKFKNVLSNIEISNLYLFIGYSYQWMGKYDEAMVEFKNCIKADETYREGYLELADIYLFHSDYPEKYKMAYTVLKDCLKKSYRHYSWLEKDDSFSSRTYDLLSIASFYCGKKKESLLFAFLAKENNTTDQRLKDNYNLILNQITDKDLA